MAAKNKIEQSVKVLYSSPISPHSKALYEAGIRTVEYTNRGEAALENFKKILKGGVKR